MKKYRTLYIHFITLEKQTFKIDLLIIIVYMYYVCVFALGAKDN